MNPSLWQFWVDVGGTFTDCFGCRPDGALLRHKLLSSGITKGAVGGGSSATAVADPARAADPPAFWSGYNFRLVDQAGQVLAQRSVASFDAGTGQLVLDRPLQSSPDIGALYELYSGEEAPIVGIRYLLGARLSDPIPPVVVRLGTTRGTNALLTRRGARTALVTTQGFGDILRIGYQNRPRLFDLVIRKPEELFEQAVEITERVAVSGEVLTPLDEHQARERLSQLKRLGIESLAICLLNAYAHPVHELRLEQLAREIGFDEVSVSHRVSPLVKIVSRGDTTVLDAYLNPVLRAYVERLRSVLVESDLRLLTSAGGLVSADVFSGKDSILSGPAGGVVGFSRIAEAAGFERAIGFDMGGTSTDVSRYDGRYELEYETEKGGVRIVAPTMAIETVAAGGGSICRFDGVKLVVGPDSAGADPGPACYGRGGPLAVTDLNAYLGKIPPQRFPFPLDLAAVDRQLQEIAGQVLAATGQRYFPVELADGFLQVANTNMAKAIRSVSIAKGYDPADYVLVAFGGAAGQHACAVARELGVQNILTHPDAGLLSAFGIGMADVVRHQAEGVYQEYSHELRPALEAVFARLTEEAYGAVIAEGIPPERIEVRRALELRYRGLEATIVVLEPADRDYGAAYAAEHQRLYGYVQHGRPLEVVAARVEAIGRSTQTLPPSQPAEERRGAVPRYQTTVHFQAAPHSAGVFDRADLRPGDHIVGPAILAEPTSTTVIDPGWTAEVYTGGEIVIRDVQGQDEAGADRQAQQTSAADAASTLHRAKSAASSAGEIPHDPVLLEIFNNQFAAIAEQMGIALRNTASSVNVKQRLDFSCAIFTPAGELVVNAPHIPVHLGAMGETVRRIIADNPDLAPGDVFVTNDPYRGGSHLPDVTVVSPVHEASTGELLFFTASRAHHAEIGGIVPGSMPPFSRTLAEEGVLIRNFKLIAGGRSRFDALRELLLAGPYPSRAVDDNLADIAAQVAANHQGARDLLELIKRSTLPVVQAYMRYIQEAAETKMRAALLRLRPGRREFVDRLDDGTPVAVRIEIHGDSATIDFTGTGTVHPGNLNANRAIVSAAVLYVLRCLIGEEIPLNQGVLGPVRIVLPECLLNPPEGPTPADCPAIVGGNVETSQRVVDVLLGALELAAASQGTMNNLLFGDGSFGYYETICGGSGATPDGDGASAVHTHMTNTRLTDPEVLELRYPVRLLEFAIRRGSGGTGRRRGGDGVVRRIEFLKPLTVSILSQRRGPYAPFGLQGGQAGALGRNLLVRASGAKAVLPASAAVQVQPGDQLLIETPGGGGWGRPAGAAEGNQ